MKNSISRKNSWLYKLINCIFGLTRHLRILNWKFSLFKTFLSSVYFPLKSSIIFSVFLCCIIKWVHCPSFVKDIFHWAWHICVFKMYDHRDLLCNLLKLGIYQIIGNQLIAKRVNIGVWYMVTIIQFSKNWNLDLLMQWLRINSTNIVHL